MTVATIESAPRSVGRVLVTGASGFVGSALCEALAAAGIPLRRALRSGVSAADAQTVIVGDIGAKTRWDEALDGVDTVVHLAARAHVMRDTAADPLALYRRVNVDGTRTLALAAARAGVRRLVFLSSIKVNGERMAREAAYTEADAPHPQDAYGVSKCEAEAALREVAAAQGLQTVVLRAPLLYGPGVKGNFLGLMRAIDRGVPLPLSSIDNRRCLLYVGNLIDAILLCLDHPAAAGRTYLLADDVEGISTPGLIRAIASALGRRARLLPCPVMLLRSLAALAGRKPAIARLTQSLRIDSGAIRRELGWQPQATLAVGLECTARWYHLQLESAEYDG